MSSMGQRQSIALNHGRPRLYNFAEQLRHCAAVLVGKRRQYLVYKILRLIAVFAMVACTTNLLYTKSDGVCDKPPICLLRRAAAFGP